MEEQQCPFCLIASDKISAKKLYDDESVSAFLDINPGNPGHTIIIPKKHYAFLYQLPTDEMVKLFAVVKALSVVIVQASGAQGLNVIYSMGPTAGQRAPHMMVHLIPRFQDDKVVISWDAKPADESSLNDMAEKIKNLLRNGGVESSAKEEPKPEPAEVKPPEPKKEEKKEEHKKEEPKKPFFSRFRVP